MAGISRVTWAAVIAGVLFTPLRAQPPVVRASQIVNSTQLVDDLRVLSSDEMEGRLAGSAGGAKARAYIVRRFEESGLGPVPGGFQESFALSQAGARAGGSGTGTNVVGRLTGTKTPQRFIVVSAHYDHLGVRGGQIYHGADDNASGTAALFAIARFFGQHRPANSLLFVAFDGEEEGLRGSRAFVQKPPVDPNAIVVDVNADMIGREPDNRLFVVGLREEPFLVAPIARVAARAPVKLLVGHEGGGPHDEDWTEDSDQYAFMEAKIPALYFGVEDYAQHHKATDEFATMTYNFYVGAVETLVAVVQEFDADADAIVARAGAH